MSRLRKINEKQKKQAAVQNIDSPFSDEECLRILKNAGYGYVLDGTKYERIGTFGRNIGYAGFYSRQVLTKKEKEAISFPIIFYNEIYTFKEKETGKYETFLISWPHDIDGQILSKNEIVTPDRLVRRDPVVTRYNISGGELKNKFSDLTGDTINSYAAIGSYKTFEEAINHIKD